MDVLFSITLFVYILHLSAMEYHGLTNRISGFKLETFLSEFEKRIAVACENLPYDLDRRVQAFEFKLRDGGKVLVYSFSDLVAEKYRAILQQVQRNSHRR